MELVIFMYFQFSDAFLKALLASLNLFIHHDMKAHCEWRRNFTHS